MRRNTKIGIGIGVLLLLTVIIVGVGLNQPAYTLTMDINPSIEIKANRLDKVVEINPLNDDARELLSEFSHRDKNLKKTERI